MKSISLFLLLSFLVTSLKSQVKFSSLKPEAGKEISFTYDPKATVLENNAAIKCNVYSFTSLIPKITSVSLKKEGAIYKGTIPTSDSTKVVALSFYVGEVKDKNPEGYYIKLDHQGKTPAEAYAIEATILAFDGSHFFGMKQNSVKSLADYNQVFILKPSLEKKFYYYYLLLTYINNKEAGLKLFNEKLDYIRQTKSTDEKDLSLVFNFYSAIGNKAAADSAKNILLKYYPTGDVAFDLATNDINEEISGKGYEDKINAMLLRFTVDSIQKKYANPLSNLYAILANRYAAEYNEEKFEFIASKISNKIMRANAYDMFAWQLAKKNESAADITLAKSNDLSSFKASPLNSGKSTAFAEEISRKSLALIEAAKKDAAPYYTPENEYQSTLNKDHCKFTKTYSLILFDAGKYKEAITYANQSMALSPGTDDEMENRYVRYLKKDGQYEKAFTKAEKLIRNGDASDAVRADFKMLYTKLGKKGDYAVYLSKLEEPNLLKEKDEWLKKMIKIPAPDFSLINLKGEKVSLSDFKGKTIVLDYWATWCSPCKASFPGMQKAINKYKANPNIVFLFIDTWQHADTEKLREKAVRDYMNTTKYTFNVLLDTLEKQNFNLFDIVSQYKVDGIPTKFLIDGNGNIRFKLEGYAGSDEGVVKEIDTMINLATTPMETAKAR